jgi:outer membrane biosynthesis protein TonB
MESSKEFEAGMESLDDEEFEDEPSRPFEGRVRIQSVSADGPSGAIKPPAPLSVSDSIRGAISANLLASRQIRDPKSANSAEVSVAGKTEPQKADPSQVPAKTEPQKPEQQQEQKPAEAAKDAPKPEQQQQEQKPAEAAKDAPKPEQTPAAAPSLPKALRRLLAAMQ